MATKDTNPKDALGVRKVPLHAVPCGPLLEVGLAMLEGGCKYGTHNYRAAGVRYSVYYDSTVRHMMDWWEGQDIDPESGVNHITKAIAGLFVLRDSMLCGNDVDDRPLRYPSGLGLAEFNEKAGAILDSHPERVLPFTQVRRDIEIITSAAVPTMEELVTGCDACSSVDEPPHCDGHCHRDEKLVTEKLDGARTLTTMPVLDLPDDNKVISESETTDENQERDVDDPKREFYCDRNSCFQRGLPNSITISKYAYLCPKHK
jgi:hypothetical protein